MKKYNRLILTTALLFPLLLSSCFDLNCRITLEDDGSGLLYIEYLIPYFSGIYDASSAEFYNGLPATAENFSTLVSEAGGITVLQGPLVEAGLEGKRLEAQFRFDRIVSLDRFLKELNENYQAEFEVDGEGNRFFRISIPRRMESLSEDTALILDELYGKNGTALTVILPEAPRAFNAGEAGEEVNSVIYEQPTLDFITEQFNWEVIW